MNSAIIKRFFLPAVFLLTMESFSQDQDFLIFLAFGQSNMEGYPEVQAQDKTGVSSRFQLLPAVDWADKSRTRGTWTTALPPLCRSNTGLCPCDYFGRTLVDSLPEKIKIGIVNVSVAGCAIDMFDKDKYKSYISGQASWMQDIANLYGGNPYARLVETGRAAQKNGVIRGILLHQGETDAGTAGWADKVKGIYNNLIKDLDLDASKIPLLAGDLLSPSAGVENLPKTLQNSYVISSQGLKGRDQWHFTAEGYRTIGKRYAVTMLDILRKQGLTGIAGNRLAVGTASMGTDFEFKVENASVFFEIPRYAAVTIKAYSLSGKEIAGIVDEKYAAGRHVVDLGRQRLPKGIFVLMMKSGSVAATRMIITGAR